VGSCSVVLSVALPAAGAWAPVVGPFCATANEAPPTSSALVIIRLFRVFIESSSAFFSAPNNLVRSHKTAAKPPLTALCNSPAPLVALGRQESVCRVVVCRSVARTHSVSPTLDLHNRRAEPELCSRKVRSRNRGKPLGLMRRPLKASRRLFRE
jgi:hypothetical protein